MLSHFKYMKYDEDSNTIHYDDYLSYVDGESWPVENGIRDLLSRERLHPCAETSMRESAIISMHLFTEDRCTNLSLKLKSAFPGQGYFYLNYLGVSEYLIPDRLRSLFYDFMFHELVKNKTGGYTHCYMFNPGMELKIVCDDVSFRAEK